MRLLSVLLSIILVAGWLLSEKASADEAQTITQYGITWTFDKAYPVGKFVTGDYWVVGPVVVKSVDPAPVPGRNGSEINPKAGPPIGWKQGYDNRGTAYDEKIRMAFPLPLKPGESLVSTASVEKTGDRTPDTIDGYHRFSLRAAAVLTCLDRPPPPDAFRPAYVGQEKTLWTVSQLHREILPHLAVPPKAIPTELVDREKAKSILEKAQQDSDSALLLGLTSMPSPLIQERLLQRVWLDYVGSAPSGGLHPIENMPMYGREITNVVSTVGLMLLLDDPKGENEQLLRHYIQLGIDLEGVVKSNSGTWIADGGIDSGRKWPVIFAGLMLGDQEMANEKGTSAEDEQTYYGKGFRGQTVLWRIRPIAPEHENLPPEKWKEGVFAGTINNGWRSEAYRRLNGPTWMGEALAARLMGAKAFWNHDAFFDYTDRWLAEAPNGTYVSPKDATGAGVLDSADLKNIKPKGYNPWPSDFVRLMWETYRAKADEIGVETEKKLSVAPQPAANNIK